MSGQADWLLVRRLARIVQYAPGGGMHRADLADRAGLPSWSADFRDALTIAYARRLVDFCGRSYVVRPGRNNATNAGTAACAAAEGVRPLHARADGAGLQR